MVTLQWIGQIAELVLGLAALACGIQWLYMW